jgi:hypothetical protein
MARSDLKQQVSDQEYALLRWENEGGKFGPGVETDSRSSTPRSAAMTGSAALPRPVAIGVRDLVMAVRV